MNQNNERQPRPAAFIDRDGTLIEEVNFLSRVEDLKLFDFTADALRRLKDAGFLIVVVTNQSGIGRGIYEEAAMHSIHREMQRRLDHAIDAFYFCPHLPDAGCRCRKPRLGMIEDAVASFNIDLGSSWMIGDKRLDVETGHNAGIRTAMVKTGYGRDELERLDKMPDVAAAHLLDAVAEILGRRA
ncbi:MAG: D-glycero-alpha-D-manno-heptose-1,7-bisphosphate 7-phosphatase [Pyrinomonadaceae bacterium]